MFQTDRDTAQMIAYELAYVLNVVQGLSLASQRSRDFIDKDSTGHTPLYSSDSGKSSGSLARLSLTPHLQT
jgi:hypothetical protein